MNNRGPDDAELALAAWKRSVLEVREIEPEVLRRVDRMLKAQAGLDVAGVVNVELRFGRELQTLIQVRRGEAFWDRPALHPTPSAITGASG